VKRAAVVLMCAGAFGLVVVALALVIVSGRLRS
jgi:hypothetical protein